METIFIDFSVIVRIFKIIDKSEPISNRSKVRIIFVWCTRQELNLHFLSKIWTWTIRVCQFRHGCIFNFTLWIFTRLRVENRGGANCLIHNLQDMDTKMNLHRSGATWTICASRPKYSRFASCLKALPYAPYFGQRFCSLNLPQAAVATLPIPPYPHIKFIALNFYTARAAEADYTFS